MVRSLENNVENRHVIFISTSRGTENPVHIPHYKVVGMPHE